MLAGPLSPPGVQQRLQQLQPPNVPIKRPLDREAALAIIYIHRFPARPASCGEFPAPESLIFCGNKPQPITFLLVRGSFFPDLLSLLSTNYDHYW